jgi:putative transposase
MARLARIVLPGWPHHLTQSGNHRQTVFFSDEDRLLFMDLMRRHFSLYDLSLLAHCLMSNHPHYAVIPSREDGLAKGVGRLHQDFARRQNLRCSRTGHLWQNRFFSCPVEEGRVWDVMAYIELNPVRAGLVENAWDWEWSSARAHVTGTDPSGLLNMDYWRSRYTGESWREFLKEAERRKQINYRIRAATSSGRCWCSDELARELERRLGRPILPLPKGRPGRRSQPTMGTR